MRPEERGSRKKESETAFAGLAFAEFGLRNDKSSLNARCPLFVVSCIKDRIKGQGSRNKAKGERQKAKGKEQKAKGKPAKV